MSKIFKPLARIARGLGIFPNGPSMLMFVGLDAVRCKIPRRSSEVLYQTGDELERLLSLRLSSLVESWLRIMSPIPIHGVTCSISIRKLSQMFSDSPHRCHHCVLRCESYRISRIPAGRPGILAISPGANGITFANIDYRR